MTNSFSIKVAKTSLKICPPTGEQFSHVPVLKLSIPPGQKSNTKAQARKLIDSLNDYMSQTKALTHINNCGELPKRRIKTHSKNSRNKTGIVGVFKERHPTTRKFYAYTTNINLRGKQVKNRFYFADFNDESEAFLAAVNFRILALNVNKALLESQM